MLEMPVAGRDRGVCPLDSRWYGSKFPECSLRMFYITGAVVVHTFNYSTWEAEAWRSVCEFDASLIYLLSSSPATVTWVRLASKYKHPVYSLFFLCLDFFLLFSGCGQVLRASKGQILLESYPLNAHCEWTIHARPGFIIQLR